MSVIRPANFLDSTAALGTFHCNHCSWQPLNHLQSIHGEEESVPEVPHHVLPAEGPVGHDGEVIVL